MTKAERLRELAIKAYWAAETPKEAKMAGILLDLFAPDVSANANGWPRLYHAKVMFGAPMRVSPA